MAAIMAATALGIDLMLPAFGAIREEFGLPPDSTAVAGTVTAYFLGLALAQIVHGPLSDRFGRKAVLNAGLALYLVAALGAASAPSLSVLYAARFVWGVGAAGPRVVVVAMIRDRFAGDAMAKALSFIMAVFVVVPVLAPSVGALILAVGSWRWVFAFGGIYATGVALWARRLPETLPPERRMPLALGRIRRAARIVFTNRLTVGYTLALTALFGAFSSYLASSELVVGEILGRRPAFPYVFGGLAAVMGLAMLVNGTIVTRVGVRRLVHTTMLGLAFSAWVAAAVIANHAGRPPFWVYLVSMAAILGLHALVFPNLNTIAMYPMGEVAGTASAVIGTISMGLGAMIGSVIDHTLSSTVTPLIVGFAGCGTLAALVVLAVERGRLFRPLES